MNIVVLTGAGISAESGLATFRDAGGIWATVRVEDVATPKAFRRDPARVHAFYNARRAQLRDPAVRPNAAHAALARLEREHRGGCLLVTQNVDGLHARAGSRNLIEPPDRPLRRGAQRQPLRAPGRAGRGAGARRRLSRSGAVGGLRGTFTQLSHDSGQGRG